MNESKFMTWVMGFCIGIMFTIAADRWVRQQSTENHEPELVRAEQLLEMYQRGKSDALRVSGTSPNFELEQSCLSLWATKQGAEQ